MILIKITKENREPEVGEWTERGALNFELDRRYFPKHALSLSVILDAPDEPKFWHKFIRIEEINLSTYPISNSEEIFQWLHDNGKLGDEWVEWPSPFDATWNDSPENGVFLFKTPYDIKIDRPKQKAEPDPMRLLRKLADLQKGPPLERYRKEWEETMNEVYEYLEKNETNPDTCQKLSCDQTYTDWSQRLFNHMAENHDLNLTDTEMQDIYSCIVKFDPEKETKRFMS